jgi:hypothetical protein
MKVEKDKIGQALLWQKALLIASESIALPGLGPI